MLRRLLGVLALAAAAAALHLRANSKGKWTIEVPGGAGSVEIQQEPWDIAVYNRKGEQLLKQFDSPLASLGFGIWVGKDISEKIYEGYSFRIGKQVAWFHATHVSNVAMASDGSVEVTLETSDPKGAQMVLRVSTDGNQVIFDLSARGGISEKANRIGWGFKTRSDDGYFGFGERFNLLNQRGQRLYCWVEDGGWGMSIIDGARLPKVPSETYVPMPWFMSPRSYGFLLDTTFRTDWDLDTAELHKLTGEDSNGFYFESEVKLDLRVRIFLGDTPKDVLQDFTAYTGRSLVPPLFQFGPWNQFGNEIPDLGKNDAMTWFATHDVPVSVHLDSLHFFPTGDQNGREENIATTVAQANSLGIQPFAYFNSMVDTTYEPAYSECVDNNLFMRKYDDVYTFIYKGAGPDPFFCGLLDFTNPDTKTWYWNQMQGALDMGYTGWMYDYGEYVDVHATTFSGINGAEHHNMYPLVYQQTAFEFFQQLDDDPNDKYAPNYVYYVRSGYVGTQRWTWNHWTGDPMCDWSSGSGLPAQITGMLNIGLSGIPFTGSDIGGFVWWLPPDLELWSRWAQVGLFSPTMHIQGGGTTLLGIPKTSIHSWPRGSYIWRKLAKLRTSLLHYIYTLAHEAHETGMPLMRHHLLDFPDDETAVAQQYQYCFGPSLLVAPVVTEGARNQTVYLPILPEGQHWIDVGSNLQYDVRDGRHRVAYSSLLEGGQHVTVAAPLDTVPFFVRSGTIIPLLDPSVDTVNKATSDLVTMYTDR